MGIREDIGPTVSRGKKTFINPRPSKEFGILDQLIILYRFMTATTRQIPSRPLPYVPVDLSHFTTDQANQLNTTWLGHSTLLIHLDGHRIITDPVLEKRISLLGPTRFTHLPPLDSSRLTAIDLVLISHDHYDHLNKRSIQILDPVTRQFLVPLGVGKTLESWGVAEEKIQELNWWDRFNLGQLHITATPARHFSGRMPFNRNTSLWCSWAIKGPTHRVFFSGDSSYFSGFKTIGKKLGPFDITFMECGSYDPMWKDSHMFPEQSLEAHLDLGGRLLHPIHWGTFNLALHPWYEPMCRMAKAARVKEVPLALPRPGETILPTQGKLGRPWWTSHPDLKSPPE